MQILKGNLTHQKGWYAGPWNSGFPISVSYANADVVSILR
jgi:hypothetical protein